MTKLEIILMNLHGHHSDALVREKECKEEIKDLYRQLVIDSLEENPINPLETLRIKIGEL